MSDLEEDRRLERTDMSPSKLAHIVLRTTNYEKMCDFYRTLLGAEVPFSNEMISFLRYDDEHHRMVIINMPFLQPMSQHPMVGVEHFAFTFATLGDLLGNYLRLKAKGVEPAWCINHGITTSIYYFDPDGNQIETQYDNLDMDAADAFMRGPYFARNQIGVDFDPELLVERYRRGDPLEDLIQQRSAPLPEGVLPVRPATVPDYDWTGALLDA